MYSGLVCVFMLLLRLKGQQSGSVFSYGVQRRAEDQTNHTCTVALGTYHTISTHWPKQVTHPGPKAMGLGRILYFSRELCCKAAWLRARKMLLKPSHHANLA
jgi:hypothetical protein